MGHIASNADMSWDPMVARESFILSNIAPQLPSLNRGIWRQLETAVRAWAFSSGGTVTVYAGSIYNINTDQRIGSNRVVVPNAFYKIVINNQTEQSLAFVFPHRNGLGNDLRMFQTTVSEVERRTGIRFPVPDNPNQVRPIWRINQSALTTARRERCRG
jgi:endonuclease G